MPPPKTGFSKTNMLMDYLATHPYDILRYHSIVMIINIEANT